MIKMPLRVSEYLESKYKNAQGKFLLKKKLHNILERIRLNPHLFTWSCKPRMVRFHHRWKRVCSAADTCCVKSHSCCVHSIVTCYFLNAFGHFVLTIHCIIVLFRLTFANIKIHLYSLASDFLWLNWKIAVGLKINVIIIHHKLVGSASSSLLRITVYILHFYSLFRMMKNSEHTNPHWRIWRKPL